MAFAVLVKECSSSTQWELSGKWYTRRKQPACAKDRVLCCFRAQHAKQYVSYTVGKTSCDNNVQTPEEVENAC